MTRIPWDERYSVPDPHIDDQHKVLVALVNDVFEARARGWAVEERRNLLGLILSFLDKHFHDEEVLMRRAGYPGLPVQEAEHRRILAEFHRRLHEGPVPRPRTLDWVAEGVEAHFLEFDAPMAAWLREHPAEPEPGDAG